MDRRRQRLKRNSHKDQRAWRGGPANHDLSSTIGLHEERTNECKNVCPCSAGHWLRVALLSLLFTCVCPAIAVAADPKARRGLLYQCRPFTDGAAPFA